MQRFTISLDDHLAAEFDELIARRGYGNRSEAVRDLLRGHLDRLRETMAPKTACVACLSYVYNHHERELAERLLSLQHEHHDLSVAQMHAHLDHDHCIETVILRGPAQSVRRFADAVIAERGVHHGALNLIVADTAGEHKHADGHVHKHLRPRH
jgi:CopG family transcriptional regulator, nickel-responsive regulator